MIGSFSTVTLTYDRTLNSASVPAASNFTLSVTKVPERFKCQGSRTNPATNCFSQPTGERARLMVDNRGLLSAVRP